MNRSRLIATTDLSGLSPVLVDGAVAPAHYERLKKAIESEEPELLGLFAEPVLGATTPTGFKNAAWYGAVGGEPLKFTELTGAARAVAHANLVKSAEALLPLFAEPSLRSWLRAAFIIPDQDSVRIWEDRVVLVNWGFVPAQVPQTDAELEQHFVKTLGALLGWAGLPKVVDSHHVTVQRLGNAEAIVARRPLPNDFAASHAQIPTVSTPPPPVLLEPAVAVVETASVISSRRPLLIAAGISLLLLGLIIGLLLTSVRGLRTALVTVDPDTATIVEATHEGLLGERDRLSKMLSEDVCKLPPEALPGRILNRPPQPTQEGRQGSLQTTPIVPSPTPPTQSCQRAERPAQLMLVMDTSGSMQFPAGNKPELMQMEREANAGDAKKTQQLFELGKNGRKRMDDAREAASDFVKALPPKVAVGIASFSSGCNAQIDLAPSVDRAQAKIVLDGFKGLGPTPIARALSMLKEGFGTPTDQEISRSIVVITDGQETCKGDPCAEAKELASTYRNLRIHVIDVTGSSQLQCLADATHGTMSQAGDLAELKKVIAQAATDIGREVTCDLPPGSRPGTPSQQGQSITPAVEPDTQAGEGKTAQKPDEQAARDSGRNLPTDDKTTSPGKDATLGSLTLNEQLEGATALILVPQIGSMGSGFFVSPNTLVTSRHVVHGNGGPAAINVLVTSRSLQRMYEGTVVAESEGSSIGGRDYAVVRLNEVPARPPVVLPIAQSVEKRVTVIASGYPGYLVRDDPAMQRLAKGDQSAAPELVLSEGKVQVTHKSASGVPIVAHSADISQGNSGGPLVDSCGRIVAINTFISTDPQSGRRGLFSLGGSDLTDFLKSKGINARTEVSTCAPN